MKKLILLLSSLILIVATGCSGDVNFSSSQEIAEEKTTDFIAKAELITFSEEQLLEKWDVFNQYERIEYDSAVVWNEEGSPYMLLEKSSLSESKTFATTLNMDIWRESLVFLNTTFSESEHRDELDFMTIEEVETDCRNLLKELGMNSDIYIDTYSLELNNAYVLQIYLTYKNKTLSTNSGSRITNPFIYSAIYTSDGLQNLSVSNAYNFFDEEEIEIYSEDYIKAKVEDEYDLEEYNIHFTYYIAPENSGNPFENLTVRPCYEVEYKSSTGLDKLLSFDAITGIAEQLK